MIKLSNAGLSIIKDPRRDEMLRVVGDILDRAQKLTNKIIARKAKAKANPSQHYEL